ncbi:hypothetical protein FAEPRAM212_00041 [Faecalibacterium prausnitzii M21/2]|uniref:Uncharacterized protein n=1 Tax=Faecalibacterium prausnitzii M21/2 TaxID=411485 RepID=A8S614_9FIRM|nr:hypothetical protein FAEPRAM212_00041 [Faecalibacterium prausnitzii M21/2]
MPEPEKPCAHPQTVQRSVYVSGKGPVLWRACLQLRWVSTRFH